MVVIILPGYKSRFFAVLALFNSTVNTYVTLNFQPEIIRINQNINITCTVHGIDNINDRLTRQWSKGPDLICYNGHPIDSYKYTETLQSGNQFKLQIKNILESDVNCKYQCRYGFESDAKSIKSTTEHFEYPPSNDVRAIVHTNETNRRLTIRLHFLKVFPLPRCTALIGDSSLLFNITSSKSSENYYEVVLYHQSTDGIQCNEKIIVKCKLIHEYTIQTEDHRICSFKENVSKEFSLILLVACILIILLIVLIVSLIIWYRMKITKFNEDELDITNCHKRGWYCLTTSKRESNSISDKSSSTSNMSSTNSDESLACLEKEKDEETINNTNRRFIETVLIRN